MISEVSTRSKDTHAFYRKRAMRNMRNKHYVFLAVIAIAAFTALAASPAAQAKTHAQKQIDVVESNDDNFSRDVLSSKQPVLVDFYATWCGPCRSMTPIVDRVARQYKKNLKVVRIDIDKSPKLSEQLNITAVPTFVIYKKGKLVESTAGAMRREELASMVQRNLQL